MKKIVISLILIFSICLLFSFSTVFANTMNNAANDVRNVVGGAENVVEDAAKDATGAVRTGINTVGHATENTVNNVKKDTVNMNSKTNDGYTATRTSADGTGNFLGNMGNNAWTWIVVGIVVLAIIALIWYYSIKQNSYNNHDDE